MMFAAVAYPLMSTNIAIKNLIGRVTEVTKGIPNANGVYPTGSTSTNYTYDYLGRRTSKAIYDNVVTGYHDLLDEEGYPVLDENDNPVQEAQYDWVLRQTDTYAYDGRNLIGEF